MAALEEAAARLANVSLTDDAAAAPPALAQPQAPPPLGAALQTQPQAPPPPPLLGAALQTQPLAPPAAPLPPTTPALGRPRSASTASAISELTATPATQAPPSTARRTPGGRRSTASPAFSPAFSTMSVRGEIRVPNRRSTFGSTTSSLRSSGSHPWTAAAAAAARRGQEEAFRREANEANIIRADEATTTMTIRPDSPPQRRSLLMDTLTRQLRREQRDSGATRSVGREAPPLPGEFSLAGLPLGTLVLVDHFTLHGSSANRGGSRRRMLSLGFAGPHVHTVDPLAPEAPPKPARNIAVRGEREAGEVDDYYALPRLRDEL